MRFFSWVFPSLLFIAYYLLPLEGRLLWMPDETRYAEICREMIQQNEWVVPRLLGLRYFEKPIAGYWLQSMGQILFGESRFAVRFASVAASGLSAIGIYITTLRIWECQRTATSATVIYLSLLIVLGVGTYAILDPLLTMWLNFSMFSAYFMLHTNCRKCRIFSAISLGAMTGMAFLTKGFIALAIPAVALLPYICWLRQWKMVWKIAPWAIIIILLVSLPWGIAIALREPDYWHYFFWVEHIQRFAGEDAQHQAPFWFYLPILLLGSLPWIGLLPQTVCDAWQRRRLEPNLLYWLSWFVMPLLLLSLAKGKLLTYILPCFAPLAILMGRTVTLTMRTKGTSALFWNGIINIIWGITGVIVLVAVREVKFIGSLLYSREELWPWLAAIACFGGWAICAILSVVRPKPLWWSASLCPLCLVLCLKFAIPQEIVDNKQPEHFLQSNLALLQGIHYLVSDDVALAVSAGWELKRRDIILLGGGLGELRYGLSYPDMIGRNVPRAQFTSWLEKARMDGDIALLLHTDEKEELDPRLPSADSYHQRNRFSLLIYKQKKL